MNHLVLLGDSIFDNGVYVKPGEPDVIAQVVRKMPDGWMASSCAVDGDFAGDVVEQMMLMPDTATHLAISAGGNDALDQAYILMETATSMAGALIRLAGVAKQFQNSYHQMLQDVLVRGLPTMVCTIYDGHDTDSTRQTLNLTALRLFNDVILREAIIAGIPVLDLRQICTKPEDYANPIEPSATGGDKIAAGIVRTMTTHDFSGGARQIYS